MSTTDMPDEEELGKDQTMVEPDDPCNSYQWSILFLMILVFAIILTMVECYALFKRRSELLSGFDISILFFFKENSINT